MAQLVETIKQVKNPVVLQEVLEVLKEDSFLAQCRKQEQVFLAMHNENKRINELMGKFSRCAKLAQRRSNIRFKAQPYFFWTV